MQIQSFCRSDRSERLRTQRCPVERAGLVAGQPGTRTGTCSQILQSLSFTSSGHRSSTLPLSCLHKSSRIRMTLPWCFADDHTAAAEPQAPKTPESVQQGKLTMSKSLAFACLNPSIRVPDLICCWGYSLSCPFDCILYGA